MELNITDSGEYLSQYKTYHGSKILSSLRRRHGSYDSGDVESAHTTHAAASSVDPHTKGDHHLCANQIMKGIFFFAWIFEFYRVCIVFHRGISVERYIIAYLNLILSN